MPKAKNVASSFEIFIFSFFKISTIKLVTAPISCIFLLSVSISQLLLLWWSYIIILSAKSIKHASFPSLAVWLQSVIIRLSIFVISLYVLSLYCFILILNSLSFINLKTLFSILEHSAIWSQL